jgi:hypothetical protein
MDSTHGTCVDHIKGRCYLYTLVARCHATGKGAPLAWMITNTDSQYPIASWLKWLHESHGFNPKQIMIDNSDTEMAAITSAFGDSVQILICHWHILRAWKKNIAQKVMVKPGVRKISAEVVAHREEAFHVLAAMMYASDETGFEIAYDELQIWCQENEDEWETGSLLAYFDQSYHKKRMEWSCAWRSVSFFFGL